MMKACQPNGPMIITIEDALDIWTPGLDPEKDRTGSYLNDLDCTWKVKEAKNKRIYAVIGENPDYELEEK